MPSIKGQTRSGLNPVEVDSPNARTVDEGTYGSLSGLDTGRTVAKETSILQIVPDFTQPRRVIPSVVRQAWDGNPETTGRLIEAWIRAFADEAQIEFDDAIKIVDTLLAGHQIDEDEAYQDSSGAERRLGVIGESLMAVVELAASIRRDKLINSITISPLEPNQIPGRGLYRIETGERRWLAYHLLYTMVSSREYAKIPAQIVNQSSVWKQAVENASRRPLTAIGKARQLAILVMDLYREQGYTFEPYEAFEHDRHYYAQVADGNREFRIPRGRGEEILNAMGLKDPQYLGQFRALLRIPDEMWTAADDYGWTEGYIRQQVQDVRQQVAYTSTIVEVSPDVPPARSAPDTSWINAMHTGADNPTEEHIPTHRPTPTRAQVVQSSAAPSQPRTVPASTNGAGGHNERAERSLEAYRAGLDIISEMDGQLANMRDQAADLTPRDAGQLANDLQKHNNRVTAFMQLLRNKR